MLTEYLMFKHIIALITLLGNYEFSYPPTLNTDGFFVNLPERTMAPLKNELYFHCACANQHSTWLSHKYLTV